MSNPLGLEGSIPTERGEMLVCSRSVPFIDSLRAPETSRTLG